MFIKEVKACLVVVVFLIALLQISLISANKMQYIYDEDSVIAVAEFDNSGIMVKRYIPQWGILDFSLFEDSISEKNLVYYEKCGFDGNIMPETIRPLGAKNPTMLGCNYGYNDPDLPKDKVISQNLPLKSFVEIFPYWVPMLGSMRKFKEEARLGNNMGSVVAFSSLLLDCAMISGGGMGAERQPTSMVPITPITNPARLLPAGKVPVGLLMTQETSLWIEYLAGGRTNTLIRNQIAGNYEYQVKYWAKRLSPRYASIADISDIEQIGYIELLKAIKNCPDPFLNFKDYSFTGIRRGIGNQFYHKKMIERLAKYKISAIRNIENEFMGQGISPTDTEIAEKAGLNPEQVTQIKQIFNTRNYGLLSNDEETLLGRNTDNAFRIIEAKDSWQNIIKKSGLSKEEILALKLYSNDLKTTEILETIGLNHKENPSTIINGALKKINKAFPNGF
ncbi:MAG: hypothetical protein WC438_00750 [Candidatus Pacearchaeota archaeon]